MYVDIVVNRPIQRRPPQGAAPARDHAPQPSSLTYRLPERLRSTAAVGQLVQVPLRASTALGIIAGLDSALPPELEPGLIRDIIEILDPLPVVTPVQIGLAGWVAERYLQPLSQALRLFLPPGLEARTFIEVSASAAGDREGLTEAELDVLRFLQKRRGPVRLDSLLASTRADDPEAVVAALVERGLVKSQYTFVPPKPAPPRIQFVRLLADDETLEAALPRLGISSKRADVLMVLARNTGAPLTLDEVCTRVGCGQGPVQALADRGWVKITRRRTFVILSPAATAEAAQALKNAPQQQEALSAILERGTPADLAELQADLRVSLYSLAALTRKRLIRRVTEAPRVLLLSPDSVLDRVVELRHAAPHRAVIELLRNTPGRMWVGGIYAQTGADLGTLRALAKQGLVSLHAEEYDRPNPTEPEPFHHLTPSQQSVWEAVQRGLGGGGESGEPFAAMIHGVTGSGKTEIYLRALETVLGQGKRAIILVPEISLTAQTVRRFEARFPGRVAVVHSQLSMGRRYDVWDRIRRGEADIVIGPRSALFAPVSRLGLIVLDEAHDGSYKQADPIPLPPYQARDVAQRLGQLTGAEVLFGSATPDIVTYFQASHGQYRLLELPERIVVDAAVAEHPFRTRGPRVTRELPPVRVVDLRQELRAGNRSIFSRPLQAALSQSLSAGEQVILFLNRRGSATFILCRDCGYVVRCPKCDVPLAHHHLASTEQSGRLVCHHCNHQEVTPAACSECGSRRIRYFGLGTEQVEATIRQLHPEARVLRWDRDTARGASHERFLQAFVDHRADVLIGTQMIAKGLDLPLVTLVGVISADTALYLPDFRSAERTFQLLTQVAGRAGRSRRGGRVIVQTYNPDHYAIRAAAGHDFAAFYAQELAHRRSLGYPPFSRLVALRFSSHDLLLCRSESERMGAWLAAEIRNLDRPESLIGPAPCFHSRVQGRYRWQIVVRGPDPAQLLRGVALPRGWRVDVDPENLL